MIKFIDRVDAANQLANKLLDKGFDQIIGIPKGGEIISKVLGARLGIKSSIIFSKKISIPEKNEIALGAVTQDGSSYINHNTVEYYKIEEDYILSKISSLHETLKKKACENHADIPSNKKILVVDDGAATGYTMIAAAGMLSHYENEVYAAVPVISYEAYYILNSYCKGIYYVILDPEFISVSSHYENFSDINEEMDLFAQKVNKKNI